jgi:hypothetical protein
MKTFSWSRALAVLLLVSVAVLAVGCQTTSSSPTGRFDPKRQAKQEEILRWVMEDHRN